MGELIRARDWSQTPLGPLVSWSDGLRLAVTLCLGSLAPLNILWGPELIQLYNDGCRRLYGHRHPVALGRGFRATWARDWPEANALLDRALGGEPIQVEEPRFLPNHAVSMAPLRDEHGAVAGLVLSFLARTELESQRLTDFHREQLRRLLSRAPTAIIVLSGPELVFDFVNANFATLVPRRPLLGRRLLEVFPEFQGQPFLQQLGAAYRDGKEFAGVEMPVRVDPERTGVLEARYLNFSCQPIKTPDGRVESMVVSMFDVTGWSQAQREREALLHSEQAARAEAENANRRKDEFLARVTHELATPLLSMRLWLDVLQADPRRTSEALASLRQSTQVQSTLVHDLLDTTRALSGKLSVSLEACEPTEPLNAALADIRPVAARKGVALHVTLEDTELVWGDSERLHQVASNLLSNAVKYTPPGGRVFVHLRSDREQVLLTVRDTGKGFPAEFAPLLFEPFRQEEEGTTRNHGGLGLGLSIARQLVELHGGRIDASSPGPGQGATFTVRLPCMTDVPDGVPLPPPHDIERRLSGSRLLLVEDDPLTRGAVRSVLEQHGAQVLVAESAAIALEVLRRTRVDAMLCDIAMPGEDGYGLIRKVRALESPTRQLPAAAFTAHLREEDRARSMRAGFQLHIAKSVDAAQLVAQVHALLTGSPRTA
ncbi:ATP-binding protein [Melittangium boletus]|uniref:hybrid sensor histidine kinase/response regulator n=1 Tax=Melittangium boletus TaxID=83453 RepID=UPI003DA64DB8